jgi:hypothetical protein
MVAERRLRRGEGVAFRTIDGRALLIAPKEGVVHDLNETATIIWGGIVAQCPVEEIVRRVVEEFDVDPAEAYEDVANFLDRLSVLGLVEEDAGVEEGS